MGDSVHTLSSIADPDPVASGSFFAGSGSFFAGSESFFAGSGSRQGAPDQT